MFGYFLPALAISFILWAAFILFHAAVKCDSSVKVQIIIDAGDERDIEELVIAAKNVANKYFDNADIFVRGSDEEYCEILCKAHNVQKI